MSGRRIAVFLVVLCLVTGLLPADPWALAQDPGSNLAQEVTATDPADGGTLRLEGVASFDPNGGAAAFEPGTSAEERFTYEGLNTGENYLVGVVRSNPTAHAAGSFVAVVATDPSPSPSPSTSGEGEPAPSPSPESTTATGDNTSDSSTPSPSPESSPSESDTSESASSAASEDPNASVAMAGCEIKEFDVNECVALILEGIECQVDVCDPDYVVDTVGETLERVCGPGLLLECLATVEQLVAALIDIACPGGDFNACADETVAIIMGIYEVALRTVCPSGSVDYCYTQTLEELNEQITYVTGLANGLVATARKTLCPPYGNTADCGQREIDLIMGIYEAALRTVCPSGSVDYCYTQTLEQLNQQITYVTGVANGLVATARKTLCPPYGNTADCGQREIDLIMGIYEMLFRTVCPSGSVDYCYTQTLEEVNQRLDDLSALVKETGDDLIDIACPPSGDVVTCADDEIDFAFSVLDEAVIVLFGIACPNTSPGVADMCYEEVVARVTTLINSTVNNACQDEAYGEQGATECANMVVERLEDLLSTVCNPEKSTTPGSAECIELADQILQDGIEILFGVICPNTSPGVADMCYEEVVATVTTLINSTINSACEDEAYGEQGVTECANMVVERLEDLLSTVCNPEKSTTPGSAECIALADEILQDAIVILFGVICPNTSPGVADMCYEEVRTQTEQLVASLCSSGGVAGMPGDCVDMLVEVLYAVMDQVCNDNSTSTSGEDECVGMLFDVLCPNTAPGVIDMCYEEIRERILASIPPACLLLDVGCEPIPDPDLECNPDPLATNSCVPPPPGGVPVPVPVPDSPQCRAQLCASPLGQMLIVDANAFQIYKRNSGSLGRANLARRIRALSDKIIEDGMGRVVPDVVLLQEVYTEHARDIADRLLSQTGFPFEIAHSFTREESQLDTGLKRNTQKATAILYNELTVTKRQHGALDTTYSLDERCEETPELQDLDGDGIDDCAYATDTHHATALLEERLDIPADLVVDGDLALEVQAGPPVEIAVASVHFVRGGHLGDGVNVDHKKAQWAERIAAGLESDYPSADTFVMAGDFNHRRCPGELPSVPPYETVACNQRPMWDTLSGLGYHDSVFQSHSRSDSQLNKQYLHGGLDEHGVQASANRIDFIFSKSEAVIHGASHDITCGAPRTCKEEDHPDRYSDHRLLWAFVGPLARPPAAIPAEAVAEL